MVVILERPSVVRVLRLSGSKLTELEGHKLLRSKEWGDRARAIAALEKLVARSVKNGWKEGGRTPVEAYTRVLDALHTKMDSWRSLPEGTKNLVQSSGHIPARAATLEELAHEVPLPVRYRDFLASTSGFGIVCRFEKNDYRNEAVATFLGTNALRSLSRDLANAYSKAVAIGDLVVEVDVANPHVTYLDTFSGAVLHRETERVTVWREGSPASEHDDFAAFFEAWLRSFDERVLDTWADAARR